MTYPCVLHGGNASTEKITRAQLENTIFSRHPEKVVVLLKGITEHKVSVRFRDDNWKWKNIDGFSMHAEHFRIKQKLRR